MKISKFIYTVVVACLVLTSCKTEDKKAQEDATKKEVLAENPQKLAMHISGMTCEIGCAKTIESKLSKKEGITAAKVVFKDSLATVEFDANKISKEDIVAFVDGIAGGELYKAYETSHKSCTSDCKKECCAKKELDKKACKEDCEKECCKNKNA